MTLANFIFVVFLILSLAVFIVLILLMGQIKKQGRLPQEKMTTVAALLFIPALIIFALLFKTISNWRGNLQAEQHRIALESFITGVYPPLSKARINLRNDLVKMQTLIAQVKSMEVQHPNHVDLIRSVRNQWSQGHIELYKAYAATDKEVRRAWIAHNTMDREDVLTKFSKQAVQIESQIIKAQNNYQTHLHSVQGDMVKSLDKARNLLEAYRKPPTSKKQIEINKKLRTEIQAVNSTVANELLTFISGLDARLAEDIRTIHELNRIAGQQSVILRDHLFKNRDLELPLTKIIDDWSNLEKSGNNGLEHIYYAIEAEYLVRKLGLPENNPAVNAMHQTLLKVIPAVKGKGLGQKRRIDQSYSIDLNSK